MAKLWKVSLASNATLRLSLTLSQGKKLRSTKSTMEPTNKVSSYARLPRIHSGSPVKMASQSHSYLKWQWVWSSPLELVSEPSFAALKVASLQNMKLFIHSSACLTNRVNLHGGNKRTTSLSKSFSPLVTTSCNFSTWVQKSTQIGSSRTFNLARYPLQSISSRTLSCRMRSGKYQQ